MRSFTRLILFASLCTGTLGAPVEPEKILVNLDISKDVPDQIEYLPPREDKDSATYRIRQDLKETHLIGRVSDGEHIIMEGDSTCVDKYVEITDRYSVYLVRIMSKYTNGNEYFSCIDEFRRTRGDPKYVQHYRTPVKLDVVKEERDGIIKPNVVVTSDTDVKQHHVEIDKRIKKPLRINFLAGLEGENQVVLGMVYFDGQLLIGEQRGLLTREVAWYIMDGINLMNISSRYSNGDKVDSRYMFEAGKGFNLASEERTSLWT